MMYTVRKITNKIEEYPEAKEDSERFPEIVERLDDEFDLAVMDENGEWCWAKEFFAMVEVREFYVSK